MQQDRRDRDSVSHEVDDDLGRERSRRARHLGATGFGAEDLLIRGERPRVRGVSVADRLAVAGQVVEHGAVQVWRRDPQAARAGEAFEQRDVSATRKIDVTGDVVVERRRRVVDRLPCLDQPQPPWQLGREVDPDRSSVACRRCDRGGHRRRRVHDDEVAGRDMAGEVGERGVHDSIGPVRDEQAHIVTPAAADLGGLACFERGIEGE